MRFSTLIHYVLKKRKCIILIKIAMVCHMQRLTKLLLSAHMCQLIYFLVLLLSLVSSFYFVL